jgi:hypothetical protein
MIAAKSTFCPFTRSFEGPPIHKSVPVSDLCVLCVSVFNSPNLSPFNFELLAPFILSLGGSVVEGSTFNCSFPKSRRIRTYEKCAHNLFRIRTYKTRHLKSFRIRTYEKRRGEGVLLLTRFPTRKNLSSNPTKDFCHELRSGVRGFSSLPTIEDSDPVGKDSYPERFPCIPNASTTRRTEAGRFFGAGLQCAHLHASSAISVLSAAANGAWRGRCEP